MKKNIIVTSAILIFFSLLIMNCGSQDNAGDENLLKQDFDEIIKKAEGTEVTFYMWGGSTTINTWIDEYVAGKVKELYDITLKRSPMDAGVFVNKLLTEKDAGKQTGVMDLLWINGENFKNAMEAGLLFGPFSDKLPNFKYIDPKTVEYDFGYPVNNYEAPYGKAQFVFEWDSAEFDNPPETFITLMEWAKANPGRFTYPQPPDFTGSAFIRQVFYAVTGGHQQYMDGWDEDLFNQNAPMLWKYLNEIEPYLWSEGKTYPKDLAAQDTLFERGEIGINFSYTQLNAYNRILQGRYKNTVRSFVMKDGSINNRHFVAIPFNAPNKAGAMVVADFLMSPVAQASKNDPMNWGDFTVLSMEKLGDQLTGVFDTIDLGEATVPLEILDKYAVPEVAPEYVTALEKGWEENVLKK